MYEGLTDLVLGKLNAVRGPPACQGSWRWPPPGSAAQFSGPAELSTGKRQKNEISVDTGTDKKSVTGSVNVVGRIIEKRQRLSFLEIARYSSIHPLITEFHVEYVLNAKV
jgi:hypothetical protein